MIFSGGSVGTAGCSPYQAGRTTSTGLDVGPVVGACTDTTAGRGGATGVAGGTYAGGAAIGAGLFPAVWMVGAGV